MTASEQKRVLIETALDALQRAQALDEREALTVDKWLAWYDATIPLVTNIRVIAGAMEIELEKRRGQQLEARGEQRGGDQSNLTPGVSSLSPAEQQHRRRARILGREPAVVDEYVRTEAQAGRVPTKKGAVRHVQRTRAARQAKRLIRPAIRPPARTPQIAHWAQQVLTALDAVADGEWRTDAAFTRLTGVVDVDGFLRRVQLIPWLTIDRTAAGTCFTIDTPLRNLCETWVPRPELGGQSFAEFFATLRTEIIRRRKENHDERGRRRWSTVATIQAEQSHLLDDIESQLDRVSQMAQPVPTRHTTVAGGSHGLSSAQRRAGAPDTSAGLGVRDDARTPGGTPSAG